MKPIHFFLMSARLGWLVLFVFAFSASLLCQQEKAAWHEYKSAADGFTLSVPTLPTPHDSPALPGATAYVIPLKEAHSGVALKVKKQVADCGDIIARLKNGIRAGKEPSADPSSVRDISIEGHAGVEYRWKKSDDYTILERWYCGDQRIYIFSVNWPSKEAFPADATIILDSFRLLPIGE